LGWNVNYDFNDSDFMIARRLVSMYFTKAVEDGDELIPWGSIRYLVGQAMYGGRVSDGWDRRGLVVYCEEFFGDFLFDDCQHFFMSQGTGFDYDCPEGVQPVDVYKERVEGMPLVNSPAVYGLHPNAEIMFFLNSTKTMWRDLSDLQPRAAGGGEGVSYEEHLGGVANDIKEKVPEQTDIVATRKLLGDTVSPEEVVLLQELARFNNLTKSMHDTLVDLGRALIGEIGMSDTLDALGNSLHMGELPGLWSAKAPWTQKPIGSWMMHFTHRDRQYQAWIKEGSPAVMWLSGLHIAESYLTALVQTTCRLKLWPLDKSTLFTVVTRYPTKDDVPAKLESGCYVEGIYLEGA
jgi:dynein heavy chain